MNVSRETSPDWMVETIQNESRKLSSTPKSVADAVWFELQERLALEFKERMEAINGETMRMVSEWKLIDRRDLTITPGFRDGKIPS